MIEETQAWLVVLTKGEGYPFALTTEASLGVLPETYYQVVDEFGWDPLSKDPTSREDN